jgi:hypothetical protein
LTVPWRAPEVHVGLRQMLSVVSGFETARGFQVGRISGSS